MLRIAVQAKGRLFDETMSFLEESDIKLSATKRTLLVQSSNFPLEVLFLRDDDIPQTVATGVADLGIVGENEFMEKAEDAEIVKRLGFSKCRLSLALPKDIEYTGPQWFEGKKIATSYPGILSRYLKEQGVRAEIHVITGSVEVSPGIGLADAIFDIVSSGSTLVSNRLKEVEVVMKSEALLIGNKNMSEEKKEILDELLFRMNAVKTAEDKKYVLMNAPKDRLDEIIAVLPGMKSPTVMPLAQEGWCSVHTVLDEKNEIESRQQDLGKDKEIRAEQELKARQSKEIMEEKVRKRKAVIDKMKSDKATVDREYDEMMAASKQITQMLQRSSMANMPRVAGNGSMIWPVGGTVTSEFGWRTHPISGTQKFHSGIDIGADYGSPIAAAQAGTVEYAGWISGYGNAVIINHGGGITTLYGHNQSLAVSVGQQVSQGETIAYCGSTGNSTGPHCHFEVRQNGEPVSPYGFL